MCGLLNVVAFNLEKSERMKTTEQIEERLSTLHVELHSATEWVASATKRYMDARQMFGKDVDRGELETAADAADKINTTIATLEWVLSYTLK